MAVRLRPRNAEELEADADFADCVELQPEVCFEVQHPKLPPNRFKEVTDKRVTIVIQ